MSDAYIGHEAGVITTESHDAAVCAQTCAVCGVDRAAVHAWADEVWAAFVGNRLGELIQEYGKIDDTDRRMAREWANDVMTPLRVKLVVLLGEANGGTLMDDRNPHG